VKLLRVLQTRTFQRLGDTRNLEFKGKIIAATNRDLSSGCARGEFRHDFYYRSAPTSSARRHCASRSPAIAQELRLLVHHVAQHLLPDEADALTDEAMRDIDEHLGRGLRLAGQLRELEQCVRNVLMHGAYQPHPLNRTGDDGDALEAALRAGTLTADELLSQYCAHVYRLTERTRRRPNGWGWIGEQ
jgi:transcriptional regulator with GAF, ATPase, and Fis domain